jgi:hypothetical protein
VKTTDGAYTQSVYFCPGGSFDTTTAVQGPASPYDALASQALRSKDSFGDPNIVIDSGYLWRDGIDLAAVPPQEEGQGWRRRHGFDSTRSP